MTIPEASPEGKNPGDWGFDGACNPTTGVPSFKGYQFVNFSVGIFQWESKSRGGLKRGKVVKRISGPIANPEAVYVKARAWIYDTEQRAALWADAINSMEQSS